MRAEPLDKFHLLHFNSKLHLKTNIWRNAQEDLCIINCEIKGWLLFTSSAVHFSLYWFPSLKKSQGMKLIPYISAGKSMRIGFCQWMASYCFGDSVKADALEGSLKVRTGANVTYWTVRWWQVKTMPHRHTWKHYYAVWQEVRCERPCVVGGPASILVKKAYVFFDGESFMLNSIYWFSYAYIIIIVWFYSNKCAEYVHLHSCNRCCMEKVYFHTLFSSNCFSV